MRTMLPVCAVLLLTSACERQVAPIDELRNATEALMEAETAHKEKNGQYTDAYEQLPGLILPAAVVPQLVTVAKEGQAWSAQVIHRGLPGKACVAYLGESPVTHKTIMGLQPDRPGQVICDK